MRCMWSIQKTDSCLGTTTGTVSRNILLSRSDGNGFFKHLEDGEITTIDDVSGWQVKVGYYGGKTEDPYWHCVGSRR